MGVEFVLEIGGALVGRLHSFFRFVSFRFVSFRFVFLLCLSPVLFRSSSRSSSLQCRCFLSMPAYSPSHLKNLPRVRREQRQEQMEKREREEQRLLLLLLLLIIIIILILIILILILIIIIIMYTCVFSLSLSDSIRFLCFQKIRLFFPAFFSTQEFPRLSFRSCRPSCASRHSGGRRESTYSIRFDDTDTDNDDDEDDEDDDSLYHLFLTRVPLCLFDSLLSSRPVLSPIPPFFLFDLFLLSSHFSSLFFLLRLIRAHILV